MKTATKKIKITRGNQYNPAGYYLRVLGGSLHAWGAMGRKMDGSTGLTWDGTYRPSDAADRATIETAIGEVLADGKPRTVEIGRPEKAGAASPEWRSDRGLTLTEEMDREDSIY
jgi:hypothetical protein